MILCILYDEEGRYQNNKGPVDEEDVINLIIHSARHKYYIGNFLLFKSVNELTDYYSKHSLAMKDLKLKLRRPVALASWELRAEVLQLGKSIDKTGCIEIRRGLFRRDNKNWEAAVTTVRGRSPAAKLTIQEMMRQCRLLRDLHHPCVIEFYGVCLVTHPCCFLLEYVAGGPLDDYLRSNEGNLKKEEMLQMVVSAGWGLEFIHSNYIIHRDLGARNCFYDKQLVKLSGFGLARKTMNYTMKSLKKLTINWMAPETLKEFRFTQKSDVYSFGVLAFEIFSQREPYEGLSNQEVKAYILDGKLNDFPPITPRKLVDYVLDKLWDPTPSKRPSMTEVVQWLTRYTGIKMQKAGTGKTTVHHDSSAPALKDASYGDEQGFSTQSTIQSQSQHGVDATSAVGTRTKQPPSSSSRPRTPQTAAGESLPPAPAPVTQTATEMEYENLAAISMQRPSKPRTQWQQTQSRTGTRLTTAKAVTSPALTLGTKPFSRQQVLSASMKTGARPSGFSFQQPSSKPPTVPAGLPGQTLKQQIPRTLAIEQPQAGGQMEYENLAALSVGQANQEGSPAIPGEGISARAATQRFQQQFPVSAKGVPTRPISAQQVQQVSFKTPTIPGTKLLTAQQLQQTPAFPEQGLQEGQLDEQQQQFPPGQDVPFAVPVAAEAGQQTFKAPTLRGQKTATRPISALQVQQMTFKTPTLPMQGTPTALMTAQQLGQPSFKTASYPEQGLSVKPMSAQQPQGPIFAEQNVPGEQIEAQQPFDSPIEGMGISPMAAHPVQQVSLKTATVPSRMTGSRALSAQQKQQMSYRTAQQMGQMSYKTAAGVGQGVSMKPMSAQQMQGLPAVPEQGMPGQPMDAEQLQQFSPLPGQGAPTLQIGAPVQQMSIKTAAGLSRRTKSRPLSAQQLQQLSYKTANAPEQGVPALPSAAQQMGQASFKTAAGLDQGLSRKPVSVQQMQELPIVPEQALAEGQMGVQQVQQSPSPATGFGGFAAPMKSMQGMSLKTPTVPGGLTTAQQVQQRSLKTPTFPGQGVSVKPMSAQQLQQMSMKPATMPLSRTPTRPKTQPFQQQFPAAPVSAQKSAGAPFTGQTLQMQQQFPPPPGASLPQGYPLSKMF